MYNVLKRSFSSPQARLFLLFTVVAMPFLVLPFFIVAGSFATQNVFPMRATQPILSLPGEAPAQQPHPLSTAARVKTAVSGWTQPLPKGTRIGYDVSVVQSLKEMGLAVEHFDVWIEQHPGTALTHIRYMPVAMQRDVASTALFIRKTNNKIDEKTAWREAAALVHYSAKYGVPSVLTTAVAKAESTFNPNAVSSKGASGVMQVMWKFHNGLLQSHGIHPEPGKNPLADPEKAIAAGCLLLSRYIKTYGSVQTAMERYYGGKSTAYQRKINRNIASIVTHHSQRFD